MLVIKKYGNRRLYDTAESRYITLEELAARIRQGIEIRVVDARSERDLTQVTLAQIILESRGAAKLLPAQLLTQLIRMEDQDLAEFFGRFVGGALELYVQARQGAQGLLSYSPFSALPFNGVGPLGRLFGAGATTPPEAPPAAQAEVAELRRELDQLKRQMKTRQTSSKGRRR